MKWMGVDIGKKKFYPQGDPEFWLLSLKIKRLKKRRIGILYDWILEYSKPIEIKLLGVGIGKKSFYPQGDQEFWLSCLKIKSFKNVRLEYCMTEFLNTSYQLT